MEVEGIEELLMVKQQPSPIHLFAKDNGHGGVLLDLLGIGVGGQADLFSWGIQKELDSEEEPGVNSSLVGGDVVYEGACCQALPLPLCPLRDLWGFEP